MYYIVYDDKNGNTFCELVSGEDAMHIRVSELADSGIDSDEILVFPEDARLR